MVIESELFRNKRKGKQALKWCVCVCVCVCVSDKNERKVSEKMVGEGKRRKAPKQRKHREESHARVFLVRFFFNGKAKMLERRKRTRE